MIQADDHMQALNLRVEGLRIGKLEYYLVGNITWKEVRKRSEGTEAIIFDMTWHI